MTKRSEADNKAASEALQKQVVEWAVTAKAERKQVAKDMALSYDDESLEGQAVGEQIEQQYQVLGDFLKSCDAMSKAIGAMRLNQNIGNVVSAEDATVTAGMPKDVVDKVAMQRIGNIESGKKAKVQVGIW